jgi:hypothetical protein
MLARAIRRTNSIFVLPWRSKAVEIEASDQIARKGRLSTFEANQSAEF